MDPRPAFMRKKPAKFEERLIVTTKDTVDREVSRLKEQGWALGPAAPLKSGAILIKAKRNIGNGRSE